MSFLDKFKAKDQTKTEIPLKEEAIDKKTTKPSYGLSNDLTHDGKESIAEISRIFVSTTSFATVAKSLCIPSTIPRSGHKVVSMDKLQTFTLKSPIMTDHSSITYSTDRQEVFAKIYTHKALQIDLFENKAKRMVEADVNIKGVCWPKALLANTSGEFVGVLVPASNGVQLNQSIFRGNSGINQFFSTWNKKDVCIVAHTIIDTICKLHKIGIRLGCFNPASVYIVSATEVYFVDADDAMVPDSMEIMVEAGQDCDIVIGNKQIVSGPSAVDEIMNVKNEYLNSLDFLSGLIVNKISQYITGRMFRKELFENGTIDIPAELIMAEDFIMNVQLGNKAKRIALVKDIVYKYYVYDESVSHTFRSSLAYEEKFCNCLEKAVKQGAYYEDLKDELAFQNLRALKMGFMSQQGKVDMKNEFLRKTLKQARRLSLTRGWKLFVMLVPFKGLGFYILNKIG